MRVEYVAPPSVGRYVLARTLEKSHFTLTAHSRLAGVPIERYVSQPRAMKEDGSPDLEIFSFVFKREEDRAKFSVGSEVLLEEGPNQSLQPMPGSVTPRATE